MAHLYWYLRALLGTWLRDDRAQDALEYLLIAGIVTVAILTVMVAAFPNQLVDQVCSAISGIDGHGEGIELVNCGTSD